MRRSVVIGIAVWAAVIVVWAARPITDHVPTGVIDDEPTAQAVECHAPFSGDDGPAGTVPEVEPPRAYQRDPCTGAHERAQAVLALNAVTLGVGLAGWGWFRARRSDPPE